MTRELSPISTVDALVEALRSEILSGAIPPGTQLRELELAASFRVGRNSVRAALQALVHTGLLRHEPNRGAFVPRFGAEDVADLFRLRRALESEAIVGVIRNEVDLQPVDKALVRLNAVTAATEWNVAVEADLAVHLELVRLAGGERLGRVYEGLIMEMRLLLLQVAPVYPEPQVLGPIHDVLILAIRSGDQRVAVDLMRDHLQESEVQVADAISGARRTGQSA